MAGTVVSDTLQDGAGNSTATTNAIQGSAKAWGSYSYVLNSVPTLRKTYNISSITRNSTGNYTLTFSTSLPDANYSVVANGNELSSSNAILSFSISRTTTNFVIITGYVSATNGTLTVLDTGFDFVLND